jgi:hypothetical protein
LIKRSRTIPRSPKTGTDGFRNSKLFEELFEQIVRQCLEVGLVEGKQLSVDGTFVEANAAKESRVPREQLAEAAQVHRTVRQYLKEVEEQNPMEEPVKKQDQVSTTDPDSTYATKGGIPARMGYYNNYLIDNSSCVIVGVQATAARMSQETIAAEHQYTCRRPAVQNWADGVGTNSSSTSNCNSPAGNLITRLLRRWLKP